MNSVYLSRSSLYVFLSSAKRSIFCRSKGYLFPNKSPRLYFSSGYFPTEKVSSLKSDIVLYTSEKTKLIRNISIYGIAQFGICIFLGINTFLSLKDIKQSNIQPDEKSWRSINLGDVKYRVISGLTCCGLGFLTAFICYSLPSRMIKLVTLHKGGNLVSLVTYGPFGRTRELKLPLQQMTCMVSREQAKSYIPIRIKNNWFFFLIDCKGQFHQPALFDVTVGARNWKV